MRLPRFTIAGLMGLVVVVAVGVAALRFASELWAGLLLMPTLGVLGAAVHAFHERAGSRRSWWRGFALFGWGYLVLAMGPWSSEAIAPHLPTTMGLDALYARLHPKVEEVEKDRRPLALRQYIDLVNASSATPSYVSIGNGKFVVVGSPPGPTPEPFRRVGHCLWALLVAGVGGVVGRALHTTGARASG
jgi:hypothetical protein